MQIIELGRGNLYSCNDCERVRDPRSDLILVITMQGFLADVDSFLRGRVSLIPFLFYLIIFRITKECLTFYPTVKSILLRTILIVDSLMKSIEFLVFERNICEYKTLFPINICYFNYF